MILFIDKESIDQQMFYSIDLYFANFGHATFSIKFINSLFLAHILSFLQ